MSITYFYRILHSKDESRYNVPVDETIGVADKTGGGGGAYSYSRMQPSILLALAEMMGLGVGEKRESVGLRVCVLEYASRREVIWAVATRMCCPVLVDGHRALEW